MCVCVCVFVCLFVSASACVQYGCTSAINCLKLITALRLLSPVMLYYTDLSDTRSTREMYKRW